MKRGNQNLIWNRKVTEARLWLKTQHPLFLGSIDTINLPHQRRYYRQHACFMAARFNKLMRHKSQISFEPPPPPAGCYNPVIFSGDDLTWCESKLGWVAKINIWIPLKSACLKRGWVTRCCGERTAQLVHSKGGKNLLLSGETSEMIRGAREPDV